MTKYQKYFQNMMQEHTDIFVSFKSLHDKYMENPGEWQDQFNSEGERVVALIREYEKMLCAHQDSGQFGKYSASLADKFWEAVRAYFPRIDFVGVK